MSVGWITDIFNYTGNVWMIKSTDKEHNGLLTPADGSQILQLDGGHEHQLQPTSYTADSCGIPWIGHYKATSVLGWSNPVKFYTAEDGGGINYIQYDYEHTGRPIGRQSAPARFIVDWTTHLEIRNDGIYIYLVKDGIGLADPDMGGFFAEIFDAAKNSYERVDSNVLAKALLDAACRAR